MNGENNQSISIVTLSNPVYSKNNNELTLEVKPLEFYDGTILKNFADEKQDLTSETTGNITLTRVYLEINQKTPENCFPEWGDCDYHGEGVGMVDKSVENFWGILKYETNREIFNYCGILSG